MRFIFVALWSVLVSTSAAGADDKALGVMNAVFQHMANTYMCRNALGGLSAYQAAETIATQRLILVGMTEDQAVLAVDKMAKKFETDPRTLPNDAATDTACLQAVNESLRQIEVAVAKFRAGQ